MENELGVPAVENDAIITLKVNRLTLQRVVDLITSLSYDTYVDRLKATGSHGQGEFAVKFFLEAAGEAGVNPRPPRW